MGKILEAILIIIIGIIIIYVVNTRDLDIFDALGCLVQLFFYGFLFVILWVILGSMFIH